jgi:hypothetical protein
VKSYGRLLEFTRDQWETWPCPGCGTTMAQPSGVPKFEQRTGSLCEDCEARTLRAPEPRAAGLTRCGVPARYRVPFTEPAAWPRDQRKPDADLSAWTGSDPSTWCVVFAGVVEAGKTMLATELLSRRIQAGVRKAVWIRAGDVIQRLYGLDGEARREEWERLTGADLLLLDDIGRGHDGGAWATIGELLTARYDAVRPTLGTMNIRVSARKSKSEPQGLADIDAGLYRRLRDGVIVGLTDRWQAR